MEKQDYHTVKVSIPTTANKLEDRSISFKTQGCKLFFNAQHLLLKLSTPDRAFFDYLCEVMQTANNNIHIDKNLKQAYIEHVKTLSSGKVKATLPKLGKATQKLSILGLILKTEQEARYIVNPKYVFKGTQGGRLNYLRKLIEYRVKRSLPFVHLINTGEQDFLNP